MYLVVSQWEIFPGHEAQFEEIGRKMREIIRRQPGVVMIEDFRSNGKVVVIHGYESEAAYNKVVNDPDGPFAKGLAEHDLESHARWISSERGTATEH